MTFAKWEREDLANLLLNVGPDAPTLCEGRATRDLANHLYIRESRPDAAGGMLARALLDHLDVATAEVNRMPYVEVVGKWGSGASQWSPMNWADRYVNAARGFVHRENVRRAQGGWTIRQPSPSGASDLWCLVTTAGRMISRGSISTMVLARDDGVAVVLINNNAKGAPVVIIRESVDELVLRPYGRNEVCAPINDNGSGIKRNSL